MAERIFQLTRQNATGTSLGPGICGAMTARWIRESLRFGRDLLSADQLGSLHNIAVAQSAYEIGHNKSGTSALLDSYNLNVTRMLNGSGIGSIGIVNQVLSLHGYVHFFWWPGAGFGHFIGFRIAPPNYMFFDPNVGLYKCADKVDLVATGANIMAGYSFNGGGYEAREVTSS